MAERDLLVQEKAEHDGIWDFKGFYIFAHNWLKEEGYGVDEAKYTEKVSGNEKSIFIEWLATKRLSDYFKIEHKIRFLINGLSDVEVEMDGNKKKMNKGHIEIQIKANLVSDPESKWEKSATSRFFRDMYNKYIIPTRVDNLKMEVVTDAQRFKDELKEFLDVGGRR
jgi:hypothetical protein